MERNTSDSFVVSTKLLFLTHFSIPNSFRCQENSRSKFFALLSSMLIKESHTKDLEIVSCYLAVMFLFCHSI